MVKSRRFICCCGVIATTGQDVTFNKSLNLSVTSGTFTLSLQGAAKLITEVTPNGSFSSVKMLISLAVLTLSINAGVYLTGQDVGLKKAVILVLIVVLFLWTDASLLKNVNFSINGSFTLTGQGVDLKKGRYFSLIVDRSHLLGRR